MNYCIGYIQFATVRVMNKKVYVCTGTCNAEVSQEAYDNGLVVCGAKDCTKHGEPFEEKIVTETSTQPSEPHTD